MLTSLAALTVLAFPAPVPVALARTFVAGEKLAYKVTGDLRAEQRETGLDTWIPSNVTLSYGFSYEVRKLKADGIADILYRRPTFTETQDEDFDSGPKTKVDKVDDQLDLTVSPINQILDVKNLNKDKKKKSSGADAFAVRRSVRLSGSSFVQELNVQTFVDELERLALCMGSFDNALDFNPKLPLDKVAVGDTWKQTVGYQPQKLKGDKEGKQEVQRLDLAYTYKGSMMSNGRQVQRVEALLTFDSDLGAFFNQLLEMKPEESQIEKIPMHLKATIEFDLDPKTLATLSATAKSNGDFAMFLHDHPTQAAREERFRGTTVLTLIGTATK